MRIALLGNSHAAALKLAWPAVASSLAGLRVTFFASRGTKLDSLAIADGTLASKVDSISKDIAFTSGGLDRIVLADFDLFVLYGLGLRGTLDRPDGVFYSESLLAQACVGQSKSVGLNLLTKIRSVSSAPVFVGHEPLPSAVTVESPAPERYLDDIRRANRVVFEPLDATLLPQPVATLSGSRCTRTEYSIGSRRLDVGDEISNELHGVHDRKHMNAEFGRPWLLSLINALKERAASPV